MHLNNGLHTKNETLLNQTYSQQINKWGSELATAEYHGLQHDSTFRVLCLHLDYVHQENNTHLYCLFYHIYMYVSNQFVWVPED